MPSGSVRGDTRGRGTARPSVIVQARPRGDHQPLRQSTKRRTSRNSISARIDATGVVQEVLVKPETNLAVCVSRALKGWKVAAPPRPDAWVKVAVALKRK
jgi:hypothetical protein